jgi:hypothetical protein
VTNDLSIDVDQIRSALARVLNAVERDLGRQLHLEGDPYWSLPVAAAFDLSKSDPSLTVGQLSDDVDAIRELDDEGARLLPFGTSWPISSVYYARWNALHFPDARAHHMRQMSAFR